ncbi:DUF3515 domain-containing protein [Corynebacterium tapiri]|uniref:DUF3515 domain-containing protein n=1 Tax=Corynebacterium tapiri TaxID=1448266 RepID=A0A5C4U7J5_9CORY|nr:DUF3515 domain-containing protein [Corynebacterium tapiri]
MALALVAAALGGAKWITERAARTPVAMSELPAPLADSQQCDEVLAALPNEVAGHESVAIADPRPAGTAAWSAPSTDRITLRCGVDLPLQFTSLAQTQEISDTEWLAVADETPGSNLVTWYSVDRSPVVALTTDNPDLTESSKPVEAIAPALSDTDKTDPQPHPAPLSQLEPAAGDTAQVCESLTKALPENLATSWSLKSRTSDSVSWTRPGHEPIVLRCGVAPPPGYQAGARLTQINDVPWFEDTQLANGVTAGTWYALGRATDIAVSAPQSATSEALPELSEVISRSTPEQ